MKLKKQSKDFWQKLGSRQRMALIAAGIAVVVAIGLLIALTSKTEYAVLFQELSEKDAALILNKLKEEKIDYRLEDGGRTILVPREQVYEQRLFFAAEGLPQSGIVGYEIFDKNTIGLTDFVQKLNYKRALEGELARTIQSFDEVVVARVHIMIPEPSLFIEDEKPATASIFVNLVPGKTLRLAQVESIANLVAGSVEGLRPESVTVIDANGKTLSVSGRNDRLLSLTSAQLELQQRVERYFEEKVASLLNSVVGPQNALVRVTAELNFDQVERTIESYDPESSVIRSQQSDVQTDPSDPQSPPGRTENVITNYEISKSVERVVRGVGNITRLSVAAMVNGTYRESTAADGSRITEYIPRSDQEIQKIRELIQNAIGFDAGRNDQIKVEHVRFDRTEHEQTERYFEEAERSVLIDKAVYFGSLFLAAFLLVVLLRSIFSSLKPEVPVLDEPEPVTPEESIEIPPETLERLRKRKMVNALVKKRPDDISRLIQSWVINLEKN